MRIYTNYAKTEVTLQNLDIQIGTNQVDVIASFNIQVLNLPVYIQDRKRFIFCFGEISPNFLLFLTRKILTFNINKKRLYDL